MNREAWLTELSQRFIWPHLRAAGATEPDGWRVSIGFPKGSRGGNKSIGQCWPSSASAGTQREVFIAPTLAVFDATHVLVHELIHASDDCKSGHKGHFRTVAKAAGLIGKMTATVPSESLTATIKDWLGQMPDYPHSAMRDRGSAEKPGSRLLKVECGECGYVVRVTAKWVATGTPSCPCNGEPMTCERIERDN